MDDDEVRKVADDPSTKEPSNFITREDLERLLENRGNDKTSHVHRHQPPYPAATQRIPLPKGYTSPTFTLYDGTGNAREHVSRFLEALGEHEHNHVVRLKEFSKSLKGRAYTWYNNIAPGTINNWGEMINAFYMKYFFVSEQVTLFDLGRMFQRVSENPNDYVKRFRVQALDCHDPNVMEQQLVDLCINDMIPVYKALLENLRFQTFSELHEATKRSATTAPGLLERAKSTEESRDTRVSRRLINKQYNLQPDECQIL